GLLIACLIASANYVFNEILDAPTDRHHPVKRRRPIPSGQARLSVCWGLWVALSVTGLALAWLLNPLFGLAGAALWVMGILYNLPPIRLKDMPYADVLSESLNNPIRLAMGWFSTGVLIPPPLSLALTYWMFGAFLMAAKRFAEYRNLADPQRAARYRRSFGYYTEERLIVSMFFYATLFALHGGFFISRYHFELILATPPLAYALAYYLHLSYKPNSPVQYPERLYRERKLVWLVLLASLICGTLLFTDLPAFRQIFHGAFMHGAHP
ncbi:MAG: UbiA family prenyltransferase, partial [Kiritimatiellia bacterium]